MTVPVGGRLHGWLPLKGLPLNLPAVPGICAGPPPILDGKFKITLVVECVTKHYHGIHN